MQAGGKVLKSGSCSTWRSSIASEGGSECYAFCRFLRVAPHASLGRWVMLLDIFDRPTPVKYRP